MHDAFDRIAMKNIDSAGPEGGPQQIVAICTQQGGVGDIPAQLHIDPDYLEHQACVDLQPQPGAAAKRVRLDASRHKTEVEVKRVDAGEEVRWFRELAHELE